MTVPVDSGTVFCYVMDMKRYNPVYDNGCLSGVEGSHDENWERARIEEWFWRDRFDRRLEVRLDENGKIIFDRSWGLSIEEQKAAEEMRKAEEERRKAKEKEIEERLKNWRPPTADDIIKSSVSQFKQGVKIEDQRFKYEWSMEYLQRNGIRLAHVSIVDSKYRLGVAYFDMLKFMKAYDIVFDGASYVVDGKTYILMDMLESADG